MLREEGWRQRFGRVVSVDEERGRGGGEEGKRQRGLNGKSSESE